MGLLEDGRDEGGDFAAFDAFLERCALKYEKASACLQKDPNALLAFYDFPAEALEASADETD